MRLINAFLIGLLIPSMALAGLPPTTIKGQTDASPKTKFGFQVPFQQATDLGGISSLIETGNSNILPDPGFEASVSGWTASGGATATANTTAKGTGLKGYDWDSNAAAQTLVSQTITIPEGFKGKNGTVSCNIKTVSGTSTHTITADDGTNNIVSPQTIASSTSVFTDNKVNFIFPSSGSVRVKVTSVAANEPEIYIDDCRLGLADNIGTVQQARLVGTVKVTGCASVWSTTSTTYASLGTQTGCSYAVTGEALAPTTNIAAIRFASLPPGEYKIEYDGAVESNVLGKDAFFQFTDGTNTARENSLIYSSAGALNTSNISQTISYTSPQSNITFELRAKVSSGGTAALYGTNTYPSVFRVYYFPSASQQAYNPSLDNWKVDANISGANPSLGTASVSTYTAIENASLTLTNNTGSGNLTAQIPCSSTNAPTGTTCSVGNESVGVSFNLPKAGDVLACVSFSQYASISQGATIESAFQIVETPNNAQTISQEGKTRTNGGNAAGTGGLQSVYPYRICGNFTFSSAGQKTLRLMYEQLITGSVVTNVINGDANSSYGQRDIHWEVYPITQNVPAPVLVGSVTSNSAGALRTEYAIIGAGGNTSCTVNGACTIFSTSTPSWLTVTRTSAGAYTFTYTNIFSAAPSCSILSNNGAPSVAGGFGLNSFNVGFQASADAYFSIQCIGPR